MAGGLVRPGLAPCHMLRDPRRQRFETTTKLVPPIKVRSVCLAQAWGAGLFGKKPKNPMREQTDELYDLLTTDAPTIKSEAKERSARVRSLMDELVEADGAYDANCMQGKWQVVHTQGPLLWEQFWNLFKSSKGSPNRNFQDFDLKSLRVTNSSELRGPDNYVTADGRFEPEDDTTTLPKRFRAFIQEGNVVFGETVIKLPIQGEGFFDVVYLDPKIPLRIFRGNNGSMAVQIPESLASSQ